MTTYLLDGARYFMRRSLLGTDAYDNLNDSERADFIDEAINKLTNVEFLSLIDSSGGKS